MKTIIKAGIFKNKKGLGKEIIRKILNLYIKKAKLSTREENIIRMRYGITVEPEDKLGDMKVGEKKIFIRLERLIK